MRQTLLTTLLLTLLLLGLSGCNNAQEQKYKADRPK
jgi:outer membrane lipopolysaccharide assembly protein LptE/RlpB